MNRRQKEQSQKENKETSRKGFEKLSRLLELPETAVFGTAQIQLMGNREATIDGSQGVLEYDENCVRINAGRMVVKFTGRGLSLKCMVGETLVVEGFITGVEFLA